VFKQDRKYRVRRGVVLGVVLTLWAVFGLDVIKAGVGAAFPVLTAAGQTLGVWQPLTTERGR
jgi:hypothetical protein